MATARWRATESRWRLKVMVNGKIHVFQSRIPGKTGKKECEFKYRQWCLKNLDVPNFTLREMTFESVYRNYLEDLKNKYGATGASYRDAESIGRNYLIPVLGNKKISLIRLTDYQKLLNEIKPVSKRIKTLSKKYLTTIRNNINAFIKWGYYNDYCDMIKGELYVPNGHPTYGKEVLQIEDMKTLLIESDLWYWPSLAFTLLVGCRPGETLGLQLSDYDGANICINRSINYKNEITPGKTSNAKRIIPLSAKAKRIIDSTIERNEKDRLHTEWIFCSVDGGPGNQKTQYKHWLRIKKERNLPGSPYSFRHSWVSLFKNELTAQQIKSLIGHSNSMPTYEVYSHALNGEQEQQREILNKVLNSL